MISIKSTYRYLLALAFPLMIIGCSDNESISVDDEASGDIINVGGIDTDYMATSAYVATRSGDSDGALVDSTAAEHEQWLIQPLKKGFDITYGLYKDNTKSNERIAILKLLGGTANDYVYDVSNYGYAVYSFNYRDNTDGHETTDSARWYDNGTHYFEGLHVPNRIRYVDNVSELEQQGRTINETAVAPVVKLTSDQSDGSDTGTDDQLGNYTLLTHYLGMPASTYISATVSRIKLPFQHRLARVLVYVLIDPSLGATTKIEGYNYSVDAEGNVTPDNPETSQIRFNNVEVLSGVKDRYDTTKKIHTLTPTWKQERKVVPHFVREDGTRDANGALVPGYEHNFVMYTSIEKKTHVYGTQKEWSAINKSYKEAYDKALGDATDKTIAAESATGYRRTQFGSVPLYDLIVRPTYTTIENVMYDEDFTEISKEEFVAKKNFIDFTLKLNTGLEYQKHFVFDLDANYQTAVYLVIDREEVNYDESGSKRWTEISSNDHWYGIDNQNGNTLSLAGNSWQRAYTYDAAANAVDADGADKITDGGYYNETTAGEDGTPGQYLIAATWKKFFAQAHEGGAHHGDYFILTNDITIDASELPANFIFTGHLDARDHTITFTGGNGDVYDETTQYALYPATHLFTYNGSGYLQFTLPELYVSEEIAHAKPLNSSIPGGNGKMRKVDVTLAEVMGNNTKYYTYDSGTDSYHLFVRPEKLYTHRIGAGSLFCGINGTYTTNQESASPRRDDSGNIIWEANVHKEANNIWVPTAGWRGEVINVKVKNGMLFPAGYEYPNSGNVRNCYDVDDSGKNKKTYTNTPLLPRY